MGDLKSKEGNCSRDPVDDNEVEFDTTRNMRCTVYIYIQYVFTYHLLIKKYIHIVCSLCAVIVHLEKEIERWMTLGIASRKVLICKRQKYTDIYHIL